MTRPHKDESYASAASLSAYFHPSWWVGRASAALIVKDTSENWRRKPVFVMHISEGNEIGAESVYTMDTLPLGPPCNCQRTQRCYMRQGAMLNRL